MNSNHKPRNPFVSPTRDGLGLLAVGIAIGTVTTFFVAMGQMDLAATAAPVRSAVVLAAPPPNWGLAIHGGPLSDVAREEPVAASPVVALRDGPVMVARRANR